MNPLLDSFNEEFFFKGRRRPVDLAVSVVAACIAFYEIAKVMPTKGFTVIDLIAGTAIVYYGVNTFTALMHDAADMIISKKRSAPKTRRPKL